MRRLLLRASTEGRFNLSYLTKYAVLPALFYVIGAAQHASAVPCMKRRQAISLPAPRSEAEAMRREFFAYDRFLPLHATLRPLDRTGARTRYRLDYDSIHDQRVPAILAIPNDFPPPYPVTLLVHGSGGNKDSSYIQLCSEALTAQGFATLSIDTQYHGDRTRPGRSGDIHMPDSYTMRDAWIQTVVDLRRAVDYIYSRGDLNSRKIGYLGFSQGAMIGGVLGGVEGRIGSFCLAVPGGGLVDIVKHLDRYPFLKAHWPVRVTPKVLKKVEAIANITDPIHYVGLIPPRPLLIIVAKYDEVIPPEASKAIISAAHAFGNNQVKQWDSGHVLHPAAVFDIRDFFVKCFGKRQRTG
ncbi:MAG TPA: alpha/beta fold hydrolase [Chthonomonadales bacterium]|nr:alpha/beta fold hydrolase [Chthonomonadales bacterium]